MTYYIQYQIASKKGGAFIIDLTARQVEILNIVQKHAPITGDQIAEMLNLSKATIRTDLSKLGILNYIDAKPKVGYFVGKRGTPNREEKFRLLQMKVGDLHGVPVIVRETTTIQEAVVALFLENVSNLIVTDEDGDLAGVASRKDLLKVTLGNPNAATIPVSLVMTRQANVVTVSPEDTVLEAARKIIARQIDSLPVVVPSNSDKPGEHWKVVGRITKTNIIKMLLDMVAED
ncbi:helix-turn-helix transcriptional regulator [Paenibacillus polymyxa]|uniref:helix-turn-helix transcriptional regulator n=1 Tax=Paenibacillus polymyxa TaxID=1406 RepID=UPI0004B697CD|nr:helix-turn-helix transcriptional regulator [Paenibacillus polymyxa]